MGQWVEIRPVLHRYECEKVRATQYCVCPSQHKQLMVIVYGIRTRLHSMAVTLGAHKRSGQKRPLLRAPKGSKKHSQAREFTLDGDMDHVLEYAAKIQPKLYF